MCPRTWSVYPCVHTKRHSYPFLSDSDLNREVKIKNLQNLYFIKSVCFFHIYYYIVSGHIGGRSKFLFCIAYVNFGGNKQNKEGRELGSRWK